MGKTSILRAFIELIDQEQTKVIYLLNPDVSFNDLLQTLLQEFDVVPESESNFIRVNQLHHILINQFNQGRNVVLIVDDAQNMPVATLEGLRVLSNLETTTDKLLQIVFCGQPEFDDKLLRSELRQLQQRIAVRATLAPLTEAQGVRYIQHRLNQAGAADSAIFTSAAIKRILKEARGVPRLINILCDNALITAYGYQQRQVNAKVVREIIADHTVRARPQVRRWGLSAGSLVVAIVTAGMFLSGITDLGLLWETQPNPAKVEELFVQLRPPVTDSVLVPSQFVVPPLAPIKPTDVAVSQTVPIDGIDESTTDNLDKQKSVPTLVPTKPVSQTVPIDGIDEPTTDNLDKQKSVPTLVPTKPVSQTVPIDGIDEPTTDNAGEHASFTWVVKTGDRLIDLVEAVYGVRDERLLEWVRRYNPQLKNVNFIQVGERLTFPAINHKELKRW